MTQPSSGPARPGRHGRSLRTTTPFVASATLLGAATLGMVATLAFVAITAAPLDATLQTRSDLDGDGLPNILELGYLISPDLYDTDGDGYGDGEEFARGSAPDKAFIVPLEEDISIGMGVYLQGNELRGVAAAYVPDGDLQDITMRVGFASSARTRPRLLPQSAYLSGTVIREQSVGAGAAKILVYDLPLSLAAVANAPDGTLSYFATLSDGNAVVAAATVHLTYNQGAILQLVALTNPLNPQQGMILPILQRPAGGSKIPDGWVSGALCFQQVEVVGFVGALVQQEVVSATCQDGWDGYCDPAGCDSSVGSTLEVLDPGVLIGG